MPDYHPPRQIPFNYAKQVISDDAVPILGSWIAWWEFYLLDKVSFILSIVLAYKILDAYYKRHCKVKVCDVETGEVCVCADLPSTHEIKEQFKRDIESHKLFLKNKEEAAKKQIKLKEDLEMEAIKEKEQKIKDAYELKAAQRKADEKQKQAEQKYAAKLKKQQLAAKGSSKVLPWRQPPTPKPPVRPKLPKLRYPKLKLDKYAEQFECKTEKREEGNIFGFDDDDNLE